NIKQELNVFAWKFKVNGNYSFTNTINKSFENNPSLVEKQLVFVPAHSFNLILSATYKNQSFFINNSFTGKRYITADNTTTLKPYSLVNTGAIFNIIYDRFVYTLQPEIKNLFDISYQPIPWRAMPGRSY